MSLGVGIVETLAWWHLTGSVQLGGRKDDGCPTATSSIFPPTKGKIRTRGPRHSREVWSWQLPPGTMSWLWIVCNHPSVTQLNQLVRAWETRWGLWMCRFRSDNFRVPKCIPAPQVLSQLLYLPVFRRMLKKKKVANWMSWFQFPLPKDVMCCVHAGGLQCWSGLQSNARLERRSDYWKMPTFHYSLVFSFQGWFQLLYHSSKAPVCSMLAAGDSGEGTQSPPSKSSCRCDLVDKSRLTLFAPP